MCSLTRRKEIHSINRASTALLDWAVPEAKAEYGRLANRNKAKQVKEFWDLTLTFERVHFCASSPVWPWHHSSHWVRGLNLMKLRIKIIGVAQDFPEVAGETDVVLLRSSYSKPYETIKRNRDLHAPTFWRTSLRRSTGDRCTSREILKVRPIFWSEAWGLTVPWHVLVRGRRWVIPQSVSESSPHTPKTWYVLQILHQQL